MEGTFSTYAENVADGPKAAQWGGVGGRQAPQEQGPRPIWVQVGPSNPYIHTLNVVYLEFLYLTVCLSETSPPANFYIWQILTKFEQILTTHVKNDQIHVEKIQECHFLRFKKSKIKRVSNNVIFSEFKNPAPRTKSSVTEKCRACELYIWQFYIWWEACLKMSCQI